MEQFSETSAYKIQTAVNHPKERTWHSEQGESLKSRIDNLISTRRTKGLRLPRRTTQHHISVNCIPLIVRPQSLRAREPTDCSYSSTGFQSLSWADLHQQPRDCPALCRAAIGGQTDRQTAQRSATCLMQTFSNNCP